MVAVIYFKLGTTVPYVVPTKCCYFFVDLKSNMASLTSDWLIYFKVIFKNGCRNLLQSCNTFPYEVLTKSCYFLCET